jgi:hypothetical protein
MLFHAIFNLILNYFSTKLWDIYIRGYIFLMDFVTYCSIPIKFCVIL